MPQRIFFDALAKAQLRGLDKETAMRILIALTRLLNLNEGDVKKLKAMTHRSTGFALETIGFAFIA